MAGLYWNRPWLDGAREHYEGDWEDDLDELPTHCQECGLALVDDEEVLCRACRDDLLRPPDQPADTFLEVIYDEHSGELEDV